MYNEGYLNVNTLRYFSERRAVGEKKPTPRRGLLPLNEEVV